MRRALGDERGFTSVEFTGVLPLLALAALVAWQLGLIAYTATSTTSAARTAARVQMRGGDPGRAARMALDPALRAGLSRPRVTGGTVSLRVRVPILVPGLDADRFAVRRSATFPQEG